MVVGRINGAVGSMGLSDKKMTGQLSGPQKIGRNKEMGKTIAPKQRKTSKSQPFIFSICYQHIICKIHKKKRVSD